MTPRLRIRIVHVALAVFAVLLIGKAAQVQLFQRDDWANLAERQQVLASSLPAPRGPIMDANGEILAESRETVALAVAPLEVHDRKALRRALQKAAVSPAMVRRATDTVHKWVELPRRFLPDQAAPLLAIRGVHGSPWVERVSPTAEGTRRIVGILDGKGKPVDGIELALDSVLRGQQGRTRYLKDAGGRSFESPSVETEEARPGNTVVLTLNHALQDIAETALAAAVEKSGATGGDIVVLDPRDGEIRAIVSLRPGRSAGGVPALTDPYEPGSTIKPFLAARLLAMGRTHVDEIIETYDGTYLPPGRRRPIHDLHRAPRLIMADVIRFSSNVGAVRLAERLTPAEEYEALRDMGFGVSTGIAFPTESQGMLPMPSRWSLTTPSALAMGYELGVTPLQLVNAYAAIANGGELLEPALVKEVRSPEGTVLYRHERRVVRRVLPDSVAASMRKILATVVDSGTATEATLTTYEVGGKSGTSRLNTGGRTYEAGAYTASFVALFPAEAPQYVVLVKLDQPQGVYFGGVAAAPVSKAVLEAALAARDAALDRNSLVRSVRAPRPPRMPVRATAVQLARADSIADEAAALAAADSAALSATVEPEPAPVHFDLTGDPVKPQPAPLGPREIPDVSGLPVRTAVARLHAAGLLVRIVPGSGGTVPVAGTTVPAGSVVRLGVPR